MVIINPTHNTQPATLPRSAAAVPVLPINRVLNAVVLGERAQHLYELASGNLRMMAESQTTLRAGEHLQLRVLGKDAQQRTELQVLQRSSSDVTALLRARLPQQQPLNQLMASLQAVAKHGAPPLQSQATAVLELLPRRQQLLNASDVEQALRNSGQFLEAGLSTGKKPTADLKAALLRLAQQLQQRQAPPQGHLSTSYGPATSAASHVAGAPPASAPPHTTAANHYPSAQSTDNLPGQLRPQPRLTPAPPASSPGVQLDQLLLDVRGALARQDAQQLLQLQNRDNTTLIELPLRDRDGIDVWQFQLRPPLGEQQQDTQRGEQERQNDGWSLTLSFDLPGLGAIRAVVAEHQQQLTIRFKAVEAATVQLLLQHRQELLERLQDQGIADPQIDCARSSTDNAQPLASSLLDDRA